MNVSLSKELPPPLAKAFTQNKPFFIISDFTFKLHFMYGPTPHRSTYAENYFIDIGNIKGNISLFQVLNVGE